MTFDGEQPISFMFLKKIWKFYTFFLNICTKCSQNINKLFSFLYCQKKSWKSLKKNPFLNLFPPLNEKIIEIYSMLVIENHRIFTMSKNAIVNLSTRIEKVRIRLLVSSFSNANFTNYVKFIPHSVNFNNSVNQEMATFFSDTVTINILHKCVRNLRYRQKKLPRVGEGTLPWAIFRFRILWFCGILNFLKKGLDSSNFRKIRAFILKLHTNISNRSRNFGFEFGQNRLKRSNFFRFLIFWELSQNFLTQENFDLWSWNFVRKCTNTNTNTNSTIFFCFFVFLNIVISNFKNSMCLRSFLCEEAKIKQRTFLKEELCEIGEEAIWESRFT